MIQTTLSFVLGFLCAAFLALLVAPAIWRRAVALTRRRVEASLPLTLDQIRADKDSVRAEAAMATRKLEMSVKALKNNAATQAVEVGRLRADLAEAQEKSARKSEEIAGLEARIAEMQAITQAKEEELQFAAQMLAEQEKQLETRAQEIDKLGRMYDEASFNASSRQIEIVAQEAKLDKLSGDVTALRGERKEADARVREANADNKTLRDSLRAERKKAAALEKKTEGLIASLSQHEERLERRERELERLREQAKAPPAARAGGTAEDHARLQDRLTVLTRENRKLRERLGQARSGESGKASAEGDALLRDEIARLAAEMVHLTAALDPKDMALADTLGPATPAGNGQPSLAERIRALQEAPSR